MTIIIKFNNNITHTYNNFEEILILDNYNDIIYIDCCRNNISNLPELPNSLTHLWCYNNNLSNLPKLPNSLTYLHCGYNNLSSLPELPNILTKLYCHNNNLSNFPELPNSLQILWCVHNNLSSLPNLPNSLIHLCFIGNPIYEYIKYYFSGNIIKYNEHNNNIIKIFVNKIENWFLDCKYNPKYLYCRQRLMKEYNELYN